MVMSATNRQGEFREICLWKGVDRDLQQIVIRKCKNKAKMPGIVFIMTYSRMDHKQGLFAVNLKNLHKVAQYLQTSRIKVAH